MSVSSNTMALSDDQLASQYEVIFPNGIPGGGDANRIALRMDTTFDPPEQTVGTYELFKKGVKIIKTNMIQDMDKTLPLEVRLDQQWKVHDDLNNWFKLCYNYETGVALEESATRTLMYIVALDTQGTIVKTIKFLDVKLKSLKIGTFDNQGTDPVRVTMTIIFNDMDFE